MIRKRFHSSVNIARTRSLPGADIGSNHDLTMMNFWIHLMKVFKKGSTRIRFNLNKLKDPQIAESFRAMIGGKFAPLITLDRDQTDMDSLINTFNTAVNDTAYEILGKHLPVKKLWVTSGALDACDKRRELKKHDTDVGGKAVQSSQPGSEEKYEEGKRDLDRDTVPGH